MKRQFLSLAAAALGMLVLILDAPCAIQAAGSALQMCILSLIPSLFPFLVVSALMTHSLSGIRTSLLAPLEKICRLPSGSGMLMLTGLLGGYPVGARVVTEAYRRGDLRKEQAERMLCFCNNAGPSFLFGIVASFFAGKRWVFIIWMIQIISALFTAFLLPDSSYGVAGRVSSKAGQIRLPECVEQAVHTMGIICGWVILFRVVSDFLIRWIFWIMPEPFQVLLTGFLELSNGCMQLHMIRDDSLRFIVAGCMLSFGGLCVGMQTRSISKELRLGHYFKGKLIQTLIVLLLSVDYCFFTGSIRAPFQPVFLINLLFWIPVVFSFRKDKKISSICHATDI